ncbi:MAG: YdcF family protein [Traorella sp.]
MSKNFFKLSNIIVLIYLLFHFAYTVFMFTQSIMYGILWFIIFFIELVIYLLTRKKVRFVRILLSLFLIIQSLSSIYIMISGHDSNTKNADYVLVLGYQLDHNQMSETLVYRLDKAYEYANNNLDSQLVLCGGITRENSISEASVMYDYLVKKGISSERLILEDKSTDTIENIHNSLNYIQPNSKIVILSSNYHVKRAKMIASKAGLETLGIQSKAPITLIPNQLLFEKLGLIKLMLTK